MHRSIVAITWLFLALAASCYGQTGCSPKLDLFFVLDGSNSMTYRGYNEMIRTLNATAPTFDLGETRTRVGLVRYTDVNDLQLVSLTGDLNQFRIGLDSVKTWPSGTTDTHLGLTYATYQLLLGKRDDSALVIVTITDGDSNEPKTTQDSASVAKNNGITLISVAAPFGRYLKLEGLEDLASNTQTDVYSFTDFTNVIQRVRSLANTDCTGGSSSAIPPRTTTSCSSTLDVLFVVDSSTDVGETNFNTVKEAVKTTASFFLDTANEQSRVGIITYSDVVTNQAIFGLRNKTATANFQFGDILQLPYVPGARRTTVALQMANLFATAPSQRRDGVNLAVVVILSGPSADTSASVSQAQQLVSDGRSTVFVLEVTDAVDTFETSGMTIGVPSRRQRANTYADVANQLSVLAATVCTTTG